MRTANAKTAIAKTAVSLLGLLVATQLAVGASVTVNLGQTTESLTLVGGGPNAGGLGTYSVTNGTCGASGGNTTCTLSGSFTGSTPGFTSGTYTLVTVYPGSGTGAASPLKGVQQAAGSDLFQFSSVPAGATITLNLTSSTGTFVAPMLVGGAFVGSYGYVYPAGAAACSGPAVAICSVGQVGLVAGATISGPSVGTATFNANQTYYFSDVAFAGNYGPNSGYQTTLTYVNYSPQPVTCVTNFYSDAGTPLAVPFASGTVTARTDVLQPGRSIHDQTVAVLSAPLGQGWAQASCTGPVQASVLYRFFQQGVPAGEAGVNAETSATTKFATFAETKTGVAYANPSTTQATTITITALSAAGAKLGSTNITLGPLAHGAANVGPLLGLQSFTGSILITSTLPIISLSLNFEAAPQSSSLPPGDLPSTTVLVAP